MKMVLEVCHGPHGCLLDKPLSLRHSDFLCLFEMKPEKVRPSCSFCCSSSTAEESTCMHTRFLWCDCLVLVCVCVRSFSSLICLCLASSLPFFCLSSLCLFAFAAAMPSRFLAITLLSVELALILACLSLCQIVLTPSPLSARFPLHLLVYLCISASLYLFVYLD